MDILKQLEKEIPLLKELHLGHTPMQVEHFKTASHKGNRKFEFLHHLIQMKALSGAVRELWLDVEEAQLELREAHCFWRKCYTSKARRALQYKRLEYKLETLKRTLDDKEVELSGHLKVVVSKFGDLLQCSEQEILKEEGEYWVHRLASQLAYARLALERGVPVGEVAAIAALPPSLSERVWSEANKMLQGSLQPKLTDKK